MPADLSGVSRPMSLRSGSSQSDGGCDTEATSGVALALLSSSPLARRVTRSMSQSTKSSTSSVASGASSDSDQGTAAAAAAVQGLAEAASSTRPRQRTQRPRLAEGELGTAAAAAAVHGSAEATTSTRVRTRTRTRRAEEGLGSAAAAAVVLGPSEATPASRRPQRIRRNRASEKEDEMSTGSDLVEDMAEESSLPVRRDAEGFVIPPSPARPTSRKGSTSTSASDSADGGVVLLCPECARSFPTKSGLSQHRRKCHRLEYEAEVSLTRKKARWSKEEVRLLALKEAELLRSGLSAINERLHDFMPDRTVDSIKSRRRYPGYKDMVQEFLNQPTPAADTMNFEIRVSNCLSEELRTPFEDIYRTIAQSSSPTYSEATLNNIWSRISRSTPSTLKDRVNMYLRDVFPYRMVSQRTAPQTEDSHSKSRRQIRHQVYKKTQNAYKKNRARCIKGILSPGSVSHTLGSDEVFRYWRSLMTEQVVEVPDLEDYFQPFPAPKMIDIWTPITLEEIRRINFPRSSAPGPDGMTVDEFKCIPASVLCKLFNLFMIIGEAPEYLLKSRTIFIPKTDNALSPSDLRPISVSPILLRAFHKILARRINGVIELDERQRGFTSEDGCAQNIFAMDQIFRHQRSSLRDLFVASIDLHKAFDNVSHPAITSAAIAHGLPPQFVGYLKSVYSHSSICLAFGGNEDTPFMPTRGVRQGDPLSPVLFNMVMDKLFQVLPTAVGVDISTIRVNALAYADDIVFFGSSSKGLQMMLDGLQSFLQRCGLQANTYKSFTIALRVSGKEKKMVTDSKMRFQLNGQELKSLNSLDTFKYLGIIFTVDGRLKVSKTTLTELLTTLRKAPLKPQQRMFALIHYLIPKYSYQLTLGRTFIGFLRQLDRLVRQEVRQWLRLPHDCPVAYFHASVADGGLGIPSFRWTIPLEKFKRLEKMRDTLLNRDNIYITKELAFCRHFLKDGSTEIRNGNQVKLQWRKKLYAAIDGSPLKESAKVQGQHNWVGDGTNFLSSHDYISSIKLRVNALPCRSRTSRGRQNDRQCRAGCLQPESLDHILQCCHRTHAARIKRHDALVDYLQRNLTSRGYVVVREARFATESGVRKPDLVAVKDTTAYVIDAQVTGASDLNRAHRDKIDKYKGNPSLRAKLTERFNTTDIRFSSLTISNRGIWAPLSAGDLLQFNMISKKDLKTLSSRAIIGGIMCFSVFSKMTSVRSDVRH